MIEENYNTSCIITRKNEKKEYNFTFQNCIHVYIRE